MSKSGSITGTGKKRTAHEVFFPNYIQSDSNTTRPTKVIKYLSTDQKTYKGNSNSMVNFKKKKKTSKKRPYKTNLIGKQLHVKNTSSERKYSDINLNASANAVSATGIQILLPLPDQGTAQYQRIGNHLMIKSIQYNLMFGVGSTCIANNITDVMRVMCVIDTQPNGANFTPADLFETVDTSTAAKAVAAALSPLNLKQRKRFLVIKDTFLEMDAGHGNGNLEHFYKKLSIDVEFNNVNGTIGSIAKNAPFLVIISTHFPGDATATNFPHFLGGYARLRIDDP